MRKTSPLINHLCNHIATLQKLNVNLHEQISQFQVEKDIVCQVMAVPSWKHFMEAITNKNMRIQIQKQNGRNTCINNNSNSKCVNNNGRVQQKIKERSQLQLADTATTNRKNNMDSMIKTVKYAQYSHNDRSPVNKQKKGHYQSAFQSPIESESRLMNRSIRGDTDRQYYPDDDQQCEQNLPTFKYDQYSVSNNDMRDIHKIGINNKQRNTNYHPLHQIPFCSNANINKDKNNSKTKDEDYGDFIKINHNHNSQQKYTFHKQRQNLHMTQNHKNNEHYQQKPTQRQRQDFLYTLSNLPILRNSTSKQLLEQVHHHSEEQNMLLSIQNTKLRQKVLKLQTIIASYQYHS